MLTIKETHINDFWWPFEGMLDRLGGKEPVIKLPSVLARKDWIRIFDNGVFTISCDMPGVANKDLTVTVCSDSVRVTATRYNEEGKILKIYDFTDYVDGGLDVDQSKATFINNVLTITVPVKKPEPKSRVITFA